MPKYAVDYGGWVYVEADTPEDAASAGFEKIMLGSIHNLEIVNVEEMQDD